MLGGDPDALADIPSDQTFKDNDDAAFMPALSAQEIGDALIANCPELHYLDGLSIRFVWRRKGATHGGKDVLGKEQKASGVLRMYAQCDFIIVLGADHCQNAELNAWQFEALIHHELLHCDVGDDKDGLAWRGHDFEGFEENMLRYGAWHADVATAKRAFEQMPLFDQPGLRIAS